MLKTSGNGGNEIGRVGKWLGNSMCRDPSNLKRIWLGFRTANGCKTDGLSWKMVSWLMLRQGGHFLLLANEKRQLANVGHFVLIGQVRKEWWKSFYNNIYFLINLLLSSYEMEISSNNYGKIKSYKIYKLLFLYSWLFKKNPV